MGNDPAKSVKKTATPSRLPLPSCGAGCLVPAAATVFKNSFALAQNKNKNKIKMGNWDHNSRHPATSGQFSYPHDASLRCNDALFSMCCLSLLKSPKYSYKKSMASLNEKNLSDKMCSKYKALQTATSLLPHSQYLHNHFPANSFIFLHWWSSSMVFVLLVQLVLVWRRR